MKIYIAPVPRPIKTEGLVILVDILRATSTITSALAHEAILVKPVDTIEEALLFKEQGYLLMGERNGLPPEGFDLGNSPREVRSVKGHKVVISTTNGTRALSFIQRAKVVIAACFLNLSAVVTFAKRFEEVFILCAGSEGEVALEDFFFAGKLAQNFPGFQALNDTALIAYDYARHIENIEKNLWQAHHAKALKALGLGDDVSLCARVDLYPIIPILTNDGFVPLRGHSE